MSRRPSRWLDATWSPDACVYRARQLRELAALAYPRGLGDYAAALVRDAAAWEERGKGWARDAAARSLAAELALTLPTEEERAAAWVRAVALNARVQAWAAGEPPPPDVALVLGAPDRRTVAAGG